MSMLLRRVVIAGILAALALPTHAQDLNNATLKGTLFSHWASGPAPTYNALLIVNGVRHLVRCVDGPGFHGSDCLFKMQTGDCVVLSGQLLAVNHCGTYNDILQANSGFVLPPWSCS